VSASDGPGLQWRLALPIGRALTLIVLVITALAVATPEHRLRVGGALLVCLAGSAYGLRFGPRMWRQRLIGLTGLATGGALLVAIDSGAPGWLAGGVAIAASLVRLPPRPGLIFAAVASVLLSAAPLARGDTAEVPVIASVCGGCAALGMVLGGARSRAETAERLLAAEQSARESAVDAHRYAERQHLAREIHDILAHTLSAQTVQLEGARLLLEHGGPLDAVRQRIESAQRLARDGLEETRRAVHSLRGETRPLPETLRLLADTAGATYREEGTVRPLRAEAALVIERTVQEGLTNARKHAPGAQVAVTLRFLDDHEEVEICDSGGTDPEPPLVASGDGLTGGYGLAGGRIGVTGGSDGLAGGSIGVADGGIGVTGGGNGLVGGGYGLAGMRERAALIGAELATGAYPVGPDGKGYRVWLTIPRNASSGS
jgi:signal transduction histidine kinase